MQKRVECYKLTSNGVSLSGSECPLFVVYNYFNVIINPWVGKIFCFNNLEDAKSFRDKLICKSDCQYEKINLYKAIGYNASKIQRRAWYPKDFIQFWKLKGNKKSLKNIVTIETPPGTIVVDMIELTELIETTYLYHK